MRPPYQLLKLPLSKQCLQQQQSVVTVASKAGEEKKGNDDDEEAAVRASVFRVFYFFRHEVKSAETKKETRIKIHVIAKLSFAMHHII